MPSRSSRPWLAAVDTPSKWPRTVASRSRSSRIAEKVDLFLGKIDGRFDVGAQIDQCVGEALHHAREFALQRAHGGACGFARSRIDEIGDGFGLRQVDLVVVKRALGEFAWARAPRSELEAPLDQLLDDHGPAMALQLDHMLAGIGKRAGKEQRDSDVDRIARAIEEAGQGGVARAPAVRRPASPRSAALSGPTRARRRCRRVRAVMPLPLWCRDDSCKRG